MFFDKKWSLIEFWIEIKNEFSITTQRYKPFFVMISLPYKYKIFKHTRASF